MSEEFVRRLRERADASVPVIPVETAVVVPRARRRRVLMRSIGTVAAVAVVGGSVWTAGAFWPGRTTNPALGPGPVASLAPVSAGQRVGLIGMWRVDAEGEGTSTFLRLASAGQLEVWRVCGVMDGTWAVGPTRFVDSVFSFPAACEGADGSMPTVPWLDAATAYQPDGDGWVLVDASGAVTATLRHDGLPARDPNRLASLAQAPVADDAARAWLSDPAPLPTGMQAATAAQVVGRWVPSGAPIATNPYVELAGDGTWTGSDGCNGGGGRWAIDVDGQFVTPGGGGSTLMLCDGAPLPDLIATARRLAIDDGRLVLVDREGQTIARLTWGGPASVLPTAAQTLQATPGQATPTAGDSTGTGSITGTGNGTDAGSGTVTEPIITCGVGSLSAPVPLVATSEGVPLLVQSDGVPAPAYLHAAWDGGTTDLDLSTTPTKQLAPIPPGTVHLTCVSGGATWGDLTVTVIDPGGYWRPATIKDEGCPGDASEMWPKIPSDALYGATRQEAMNGMLSVLRLDGSVATRQLAVGYPDDPIQWWLVLHNGTPYVAAVVRPSAGGFMAIPGWHCRAS